MSRNQEERGHSLHPGSLSEADLSYRPSEVSPISPTDTYDSPTSASAAARVSLDQHDITDNRLRSALSWNNPLSGAGTTRYAPLRTPTEPTSISTVDRNTSYDYASSLNSRSSTITPYSPHHDHHGDESYNMSLLQSAAPMGSIAPIGEDEVVDFDVSAAMGPSQAHDQEFLKQLQKQEAEGNLTGGIGKGFRPDTRMSDADLLASRVGGPVNRNLSRSFTRRLNRRLTRSETIKNAGQDEANRRGQVIEVVMEEPATAAGGGADLSFMEGTSFIERDSFRRSTISAKEKVTQVFYPQPNWKPWPMRWPYLTILTLLSVGLAVMQEWLFNKFSGIPIIRFHSPEEVDPGVFFLLKFGPTLAAVVYGVLWQFTDFEVRRLEAFYQLSKPGGSLAAESINVGYVTILNVLRPFYALRVGHYTVAISSLGATLAVSLVPTFAAASIALQPDRDARLKDPDGWKTLVFSPLWSHLLTSVLAICAACSAAVIVLLHVRRTGLVADVRGIAGLASMAVVSHILMDFKDMDTAKPGAIHQKLKHHRYVLRNSCLAPDDENPVTSKDRDKYDDTNKLSSNPQPMMLRPAACITFIVFLLLFMAFIPIFLFTDAGVVTEKAPWFVTLWAVCLKLSWYGLETAVRMMEPYYILSKRHAPSKTLTLDYTALPWGYLPIAALLNGHMVVFLVGFGSIMVEFFIIIVAGLTTVHGQNDKNNTSTKGELINSGQETKVSFYVSLSVSIFILLYMTFVSIFVFVRRRHPFLPRQPNTIASVLAFIHQSKMLYNFVGMSKLSSAEMVRQLDDGKTYGLGWFEGRDGQTHCGIDQEELTSFYKHGMDNSQGVRPWSTQWDVL